MNPHQAPDGSRVAQGDLAEIQISVSDRAELRSLRERLRRIPGAEVTQVAPRPAAGELGAGELLQVALVSAGVFGIIIRTLPEFIRSRRSTVTVTVKTKNETITISADNIEDSESIIKRMLPDA